MCQGYSLHADLLVREHIRPSGSMYGLSRPEIRSRPDALLARLRLEDSASQRVGALPLGWKQKLAFSVALLHAPRIVFLDEPTGGVDPVTRRQFWELIHDAAAGGTTVFVTTHYMDEAEYCDRLAIMVAGRIDAIGTPREVKRRFDAPSIDDVFLRLARPLAPGAA
jgi:ABC-2 type transport system ATP-binding protein